MYSILVAFVIVRCGSCPCLERDLIVKELQLVLLLRVVTSLDSVDLARTFIFSLKSWM